MKEKNVNTERGKSPEKTVLYAMKRGAMTCNEETSIRELAQIMLVNNIRYCVVLNPKNKIAGFITARKMIKTYGDNLERTKAKDILIQYIPIVTSNLSVKRATEIMLEKNVDHLVITSSKPENNTVLGILNAVDIVAEMAAN